MKTIFSLDSTFIDGNKLKAAREASQLSVAELAFSLTISNEQLVCIEEGSMKPFYSVAHKLIAVRKLAKALHIPFEQVVSGADTELAAKLSEQPQAVTQHADEQTTPHAYVLRETASRRNSEIHRSAYLLTTVLLAGIVLYANFSGGSDAIVPPAAHQSVPIEEADKPAAIAVATINTAAGKTEAAVASDPCATEASKATSAELPSWSPAFQRKPSQSVYLVSRQGGAVCVSDAGGQSAQLVLKPMVGQSFSGKPPYIVRSSQLALVDMYLQGLKVKVPEQSNAIRLVLSRQRMPEATVSAN